MREGTQPKKFMSTGERVLVTGASGFLGTALCRELVQQGFAVRGMTRKPVSLARLDPRIEWRLGDTANPDQLRDATADQDIVFHLAGSILTAASSDSPSADIQSEAIGTINLLEACVHSGVNKFVFISSGGAVYGNAVCPITEADPTDPIVAYGISKLCSEKYIRLYHLLHGLDYRILRVANPYGPYQQPHRGQGVVATLLYQALVDQPLPIFGDGEAVRDFIYVDDVIAAILASLSYDGSSKLFNVGSGTGLSINAVVAAIASCLPQKRLHKLYLPARASDLPANVLNADLLTSKTGWRPQVNFLTGLRKTLAWVATLHPEEAERQRYGCA